MRATSHHHAWGTLPEGLAPPEGRRRQATCGPPHAWRPCGGGVGQHPQGQRPPGAALGDARRPPAGCVSRPVCPATTRRGAPAVGVTRSLGSVVGAACGAGGRILGVGRRPCRWWPWAPVGAAVPVVWPACLPAVWGVRRVQDRCAACRVPPRGRAGVAGHAGGWDQPE
jgi:hypothetical protein